MLLLGISGCAAQNGSVDVRFLAGASRSGRVPSSQPDHAPLRTGRAPVFEGATIGIDPGHNGLNLTRPDVIDKLIPNGRSKETETCNTTGTETDAGYPEPLFNFDVAVDLAAMLKERGAQVVLTRDMNNGVGPCVDQRAEILNQAAVDVAIDIHADGGPPTGRGFTILEPVPSGANDAVVPESLRYAALLKAEFLKTGMPISTYDGLGGYKTRPDLGGLTSPRCPSSSLNAGICATRRTRRY